MVSGSTRSYSAWVPMDFMSSWSSKRNERRLRRTFPARPDQHIRRDAKAAFSTAWSLCPLRSSANSRKVRRAMIRMLGTYDVPKLGTTGISMLFDMTSKRGRAQRNYKPIGLIADRSAHHHDCLGRKNCRPSWALSAARSRQTPVGSAPCATRKVERPATPALSMKLQHPELGRALPPGPHSRSVGVMRRHLTLRFSADDFPRLLTSSYSICWPSLSVLRPALSTAEM